MKLNDPAVFPEICVLIPFFNNLPGLKASLKSIAYDPQCLTILIVDDGSILPLKAADLAELELEFNFHILSLPQNAGITKALNAGLKWISDQNKFEYVARLDCSDVCEADRFRKQIAFLENNPEIALLGSWCTFKNPVTGFFYNYTTPTNHREIEKELHYRNVFIHPTVVCRTGILKQTGFYPEDYPYVEDYAFFMKIARQYQTAILPEFLVTCEINPSGISIANRRNQLKGRMQVVTDFGESTILKKIGLFKLALLQFVPYKFLLLVKKFTSNSKG